MEYRSVSRGLWGRQVEIGPAILSPAELAETQAATIVIASLAKGMIDHPIGTIVIGDDLTIMARPDKQFSA